MSGSQKGQGAKRPTTELLSYDIGTARKVFARLQAPPRKRRATSKRSPLTHAERRGPAASAPWHSATPHLEVMLFSTHAGSTGGRPPPDSTPPVSHASRGGPPGPLLLAA